MGETTSLRFPHSTLTIAVVILLAISTGVHGDSRLGIGFEEGGRLEDAHDQFLEGLLHAQASLGGALDEQHGLRPCERHRLLARHFPVLFVYLDER